VAWRGVVGGLSRSPLLHATDEFSIATHGQSNAIPSLSNPMPPVHANATKQHATGQKKPATRPAAGGHCGPHAMCACE
jgi:hypothetical protein